MSKEYTGYLKGVAILLMVFLHLFTNKETDVNLGFLLSINDTPLIFYLTRMCNPVPFFLILSGYGLYTIYNKQGGVKPCKRVSYLYFHLWVIYLLLLPLACYIKPASYPGSFSTFMYNATSWRCSYIGEQWFFLPYILLMVCSKWVFRLCDRLKGYITIGAGLIVYGATIYCLKKYGESGLSFNMLFYNTFLTFYMLFPFLLGYCAKKYQWIEKINGIVTKRFSKRWIMPAFLLLILCISRCFISHATIDPFYAIAFVVLFAIIPVTRGLGVVLSYLGKHSMNIWLIHTWFSNRLFHDFLYDTVHYPIIMYVGIILVSLAISHIVELIYKPIGKYVNKMSS